MTAVSTTMAATEVLSSTVAHLDHRSRVRYVQIISPAGVSDPCDIPRNIFMAIDKHAKHCHNCSDYQNGRQAGT